MNGVSSIVELFLTFWKVKSGQGGVQLSVNQKSRRKSSRKQKSTHDRSTNNKAPNSHTGKHQKDQHKGSSKTCRPPGDSTGQPEGENKHIGGFTCI